MGNVHIDNNEDLPEERKLLGIAYVGEDESFFTLKGSVEALLERLGMPERASFAPGGGEYYHPGQKALILIDGAVVGEMGAIHPKVLKAFDIPKQAYCAELSISALFERKDLARVYKAIPRFPKVPRDIAIVADESVTNAQALAAIKGAKLEVLLEDLEQFDVYRGAGVPASKKSMAYSFTLRSPERTLTDEEIQSAMSAVLSALKDSLGAELRS